MRESFFATRECEIIERQRFRTQAEAGAAAVEFIERWYNPRRRDSAMGYLSPMDFDRNELLPARPSPSPPTKPGQPQKLGSTQQVSQDRVIC